ncbi:hypothetical protein [Mycobacterium colombiense]|uniref:hypothetical protein n=1 Tax=Mycobacterium colombiense TaxID=339268 RepID=UPI000AED8D5C|nr:hypothetical protein [Mycobacterium colombiense]
MTLPFDEYSADAVKTMLEARANIAVLDVQTRDYPGERNFVVFVAEADLEAAAHHAAAVEDEFSGDLQVFVIIRPAPDSLSRKITSKSRVKNVFDDRVTQLVGLISARSRVSAAEPSLGYVPNVRASLSAVTAARHHLIFGRRGAGKTALLVEARRLVQSNGAISAWVNIQTYRREEAQRVVLYILEKILGSVVSQRDGISETSSASLSVSRVYNQVISLLDQNANTLREVNQLIPKVQGALQRYIEISGRSVFVFLDDFYYVSRSSQPDILDMLHGITRDTKVWLKVASIKHLTRWWISSPPTGLQTGQDAEVIDLDVTLQDPGKAREFLETVLAGYANAAGVSSLSNVFSRAALDRLVLASGAVPRDYLVLAANSITRAQQRSGARQAGVQEINQAAGDAAAAKIKELEEDMASNPGNAEQTINCLKVVRNFCLETSACTYFLVSFRDKEDNALWYSMLTDLMDVRLVHLIDEGVSDAHSAGHRSEAFMLDLSQFSGARLKQRIKVLDFVNGKFVSRQTRGKEPARVGGTSRQLTAILRSAPTLPLELLATALKDQH